MLLTVSKRLEFSASRRLFRRNLSEEENLAAFGPETRAQHGTGRNYIAYFIFTGQVDPVTGMLINISEIKQRAGRVVDERLDHKLLNENNPAFADVPPTAHPLPLKNVLRPDAPVPSLDRDEVLAQAPAAEDGRFRVPRILGEAP